MINAGLSFAVPRNLHALAAEKLRKVIRERLGELQTAAGALSLPTVVVAIRAAEPRSHRLTLQRAAAQRRRAAHIAPLARTDRA